MESGYFLFYFIFLPVDGKWGNGNGMRKDCGQVAQEEEEGKKGRRGNRIRALLSMGRKEDG